MVKLAKNEKMNKHLKLLYTTDSFNEPQSYIGENNGKKVLMLSWVPKSNNFTVEEAF